MFSRIHHLFLFRHPDPLRGAVAWREGDGRILTPRWLREGAAFLLIGIQLRFACSCQLSLWKMFVKTISMILLRRFAKSVHAVCIHGLLQLFMYLHVLYMPLMCIFASILYLWSHHTIYCHTFPTHKLIYCTWTLISLQISSNSVLAYPRTIITDPSKICFSPKSPFSPKTHEKPRHLCNHDIESTWDKPLRNQPTVHRIVLTQNKGILWTNKQKHMVRLMEDILLSTWDI